MKNRFWAFTASVLLLAVGTASSMELLSNGDLELFNGGGPGTTEPPGWSLSEFITGGGSVNSAVQIGFADVDGDLGDQGLWLQPWSGGLTNPGQLVNAVLSQTVPASPGVGYSFSGWSRWEDNYAGGVVNLDSTSPSGAVPSPTRTEMELAFLDTGGNVIGSPNVLDLRTVQNNFNFWDIHRFDDLLNGGSPIVAPAGTANIRVSASMIDGVFNTDPMQSAFFDDFSLVGDNNPLTELLMNAGLDEGPPPPGETFFDDWVHIENPDGVNTVNPQTAAFAQNTNTAGETGAFLRPWASGSSVDAPNDAILIQTVPGVAGGEYTFTGWSKFEGNYSGGVDTLDATSSSGAVPSPTETTMELAFLDGSGAELLAIPLDLRGDREAQAGVGNANNNDWIQHSIMGTAPDGTVEVRVTGAMIDGVGNVNPGQSAFFDDFSLMGPPINNNPCDFNGSGVCDIVDLDQLYDEIGGTDLAFDVNGDSLVNNDDIGAWLTEASSSDPLGRTFVAGDTNLDGNVGGGDFTALASNFGATDATWGQGNFDGNAGGSFGVGGSDFTALASNFGFSSVVAIPEPSTGILFGFASLMFVFGRRRLGEK